MKKSRLTATLCLSLIAAVMLTSCDTSTQIDSTTTSATSTSDTTTTTASSTTEITSSATETEATTTTPVTTQPTTTTTPEQPPRLSDYIDYSNANIPDISQEEIGIGSNGADNILFDSKQLTDSLSVLFVGNGVSTDYKTDSETLCCSEAGIVISDGETTSEIYGMPVEFAEGSQSGYRIRLDKLSEYVNIFTFGENYIVALRYFGDEYNPLACFYAIKNNTVYPMLMGDYSAVGGEPMAIVAEFSQNLSYDGNNCTITDKGKAVVYTFHFDKISDKFTGAHYTVTNS